MTLPKKNQVIINSKGKIYKVRILKAKILGTKSSSVGGDKIGFLRIGKVSRRIDDPIETKNVDGFDEFDPLKDTRKNKG